MNCGCCPHQKTFSEAVEPCVTCDHAHFFGMAGGDKRACEKCKHYPAIKKAMKPCKACEAGRLHGEVHFEAAPTPEVVWRSVHPSEHTPQTGVTALEPAVEDAMRKALAIIFDFSPLELLLIQHIVHRRGFSTFREVLAKLRDRLNRKYDLSPESKNFRALADQWKKRIIAKFPPIEDLFNANVLEARVSKHHQHVTDEEFGDDQDEIET